MGSHGLYRQLEQGAEEETFFENTLAACELDVTTDGSRLVACLRRAADSARKVFRFWTIPDYWPLLSILAQNERAGAQTALGAREIPTAPI